MDPVCIDPPDTARVAGDLARLAERAAPCRLDLAAAPAILRDVLVAGDTEVAGLVDRYRDLAMHAADGLRTLAADAVTADRWC